MGDDLGAHARVPEALEMLSDNLNRSVGIGHLIGRDIVEHFYQTFDIHGRLTSTVNDAIGMGVDDQVRPAYKSRECELAGLRQAHGPCGWG